MTDLKIECPECGHGFALTDSLAAPIVEEQRREFEARLEFAKKESAATLKAERERISAEANRAAKEAADEEVRTLREQAARILKTQEKVKEEARTEIAEVQKRLAEQEAKLAAAQKAQADALRAQRELEDAKRELDLTVEKRVSKGLGEARTAARAEAEESLRLRLTEKEEQMASMARKIEELKQKAEQGSQQLQGEVQEIELEAALKTAFPYDTIEPVPKGEFGGDIVQRVYTQNGVHCGTILWESKRTRNWSDTWLPKLRGDQRTANAEVAVLVTQTLPKGLETFDVIDSVWVTGVKTFIPVATVLRQSIISVHTAKAFGEGQETKAQMIYRYLTGAQFKSRVEAIVEAFGLMQEDLAKERKAITKQWAKRDEQLQNGLVATLGLYGDMQGIAGKAIGEIESVSLKALEA